MALLPSVLSSFSQYFWIREQVSSNGICFWAQVEGSIEEHELVKALRSICERYPLLRAVVGKRQGEMPEFIEKPAAIELSFLQSQEDDSLASAIHREMLRGSADSLFRVVLLQQSPETFKLLFVLSHAVSDAQGAALIMRDLLTALSGGTLEPASVDIVTHEDVLCQPELRGYSQALTEKPTADAETERRQRTLQVTLQSLSAPEVDALVHRTRQEKTTVQAALMAAAVRVARTLHAPWNAPEPLKMLVPMDLRRFWTGAETANLLTRPVSVSVSNTESLDFWSLARLCKAKLEESASFEQSQAFVRQAHELLSLEWDPQIFFEATNHATPHQLFLSNLGLVKIPKHYGGLSLCNVGFCHLSGPALTQSLCVATFDGTMCLSQTSQQPIAGLLHGIRRMLLDQSR